MQKVNSDLTHTKNVEEGLLASVRNKMYNSNQSIDQDQILDKNDPSMVYPET